MSTRELTHAPTTQAGTVGLPRWVVVAAVVGTAVIAAGRLLRAADRPHVVETYQASQFWLTYEHGFVRRGLPGQLLALLAGGPPTARQVAVAAVVLAIVGLGALAVLVAAVVRLAPGPARPATVALLACSPFTFSLVVLDLGRYDTIGFAALAVVAVGCTRWRPTVGIAIASVALLVAAASQEFLAAFVAPQVVLLVRQVLPTGRRLAAVAVAILPGAVAAGWGLLTEPPTAGLVDLVGDANAARPDVTVSSPVNAIAAVSQDLDGAVDHLSRMSPEVMPLLTAVFGGCFLAAAGLVWYLTGRREPRLFGVLVAWCAVAAIGLGVAGIDYRRWWALAFVTVLAALPLLAVRPRPAHAAPSRLVGPGMVAAVVGLSLVEQPVPVAAAILLDPAAQTRIHLPVDREKALVRRRDPDL